MKIGNILTSALLLGILVLTGCAMDLSDPEDVETRSFEIAVAGPWNPSASTRAIAATQYVPVIDPPAVSPAGSCRSSNAFQCSCTHPSCSPAYQGTRDLDAYIRQRHGSLTSGGLYCCRQNSATTSVPKLSVHAIGRAIDIMVPTIGGDANNSLGDPVANWLVENAEFIGIQRVIWDKAYWNGERGFGLLSSASLSHTNHIHIELSPAGAARQTPFFTSGAVNGVCTARCEGTRIINADCSSGDCAAFGAACLPGNPPMCGQPPPPEPPSAVAVNNPTLPTMSTNAAPGRFNFASARVFDTRGASTNVVRGNGSTSGPLTAAGLNVATLPNIPGGANAVWLNMTAILPPQAGFLTVFPAGTPEPPTSSLNYFGGVRANAVPVVLGTGDRVAIKTVQDVDVVADVFGTFAPTGDGLESVTPRRVMDTRQFVPISAEGTLEVNVQAPAGATGVLATVAVLSGDDPGFLSAYPCGTPVPETSNINFGANSVVANSVISRISADGRLCFYSYTEADVIVDVAGYLHPTAPLSYQPLNPGRVLDTRSPQSIYTNRLADEQIVEIPIQSLPGMPDGVWSVAANLVALNADRPGFLTAFPCGSAVPNTSSLNYAPGEVVAAMSTTSVGANGNLCVFAKSRTHLIVDIQGIWTHIDVETPPTPVVNPNPADEGDKVDPGDPQLPPSDPNNPFDPFDPNDPNNPNNPNNPNDPMSACFGVSCPAGEACLAGGCFLTCGQTSDCTSSNEFCYEDVCIPSDPNDPASPLNACFRVSCPAGEACLGGDCFADCTQDSDCTSSNDFCFQDVCVPSDPNDPANPLNACFAVSCAAGQSCLGGDCFPNCTQDTDCTEPGSSCSQSVCVPDDYNDPNRFVDVESGCSGCASGASNGNPAVFLFLMCLFGLSRRRAR